MAENRSVKARRPLLMTCWLTVLVCAGVTNGDGTMFVKHLDYEDILQPTQKVHIRWDGEEEELLIQTKYEGPAEEMVWIVPVPSEPVVERGDGVIFEELSDKTDWPDMGFTRFVEFWTPYFGIDRIASWGAAGGASPVEWRRRIGDYDVVLLRPVGGEDVVDWLMANDFAVPEEAIPILNDYVLDGWWMVASKIHPEALTDITRDELAKGTLHPLAMTFASAECVYPLRLTSMAAGPVEELIYIESSAHYVPATLSEGDWQIDILGGPQRPVRQPHYQTNVEQTLAIREGRIETKAEPCLTKLRRVFEPNEMTEDLVFARLDYSTWLASEDPLRIGLAATQYGRHRDPNGVPHLVNLLSSGLLDQVQPAPEDYQDDWLSASARILDDDGYFHWGAYRVATERGGPRTLQPIGEHVYACIWALGEIAVDHAAGGEIKALLLDCAQHDNQYVRGEAMIALMKLNAPELGPIFAERVAWIPDHGPEPDYWNEELAIMSSEMNMAAEWIVRFGTEEQKVVLAEALKRSISHLEGSSQYSYLEPDRSVPSVSDLFMWIGWQAASARDAALVGPLEALRGRLVSDDEKAFVLRAEAACGSGDAIEVVTGQIVADEARVAVNGQDPAPEDLTSLETYYGLGWGTSTARSLRVRILDRHWVRYHLHPMPSEASDAIFRSVLSMPSISDWYALYLLAGIKDVQEDDRARLMRIWDAGSEPVRLVVADVRYVWDEREGLLALYENAESDEVRSEIVWALADLGEAKAVDLIEEHVYGSWNAEWLATGRPFAERVWWDYDVNDPVLVDAVRKAEAVQDFFHPEWVALNDRCLASLKAMAGDSTIHPGMRFRLLASDYATKDWARPLLEAAALGVLEGHPDPYVVREIQLVDVELVIGACAASESDAFRSDLLLGLLEFGSGFYMPVVEGLLSEVWPQRYIQTEGQSDLFHASDDLAAKLDYYSEHCHDRRWYTRALEDVLEPLVRAPSLPAGYRGFLLVHWLTAPSRISQGFVEGLLLEEMPDFIRDALEQRLLKWGQDATAG